MLDGGKLKDADCQAQLQVNCADAAAKIQDAIDATKDALRSGWRQTKETYVKDISQEMVNDYAAAAVLARTLNLKDTTVQNGVARLAYFTDYLGDPTMQAFVEAAPDPVNVGQKLHYIAGRVPPLALRSPQHSARRPGRPSPLPANPMPASPGG